MVTSKLLVHSLPAFDERPSRHVNGVSAEWINGSRVSANRRRNHEGEGGQNGSRCHHGGRAPPALERLERLRRMKNAIVVIFEPPIAQDARVGRAATT